MKKSDKTTEKAEEKELDEESTGDAEDEETDEDEDEDEDERPAVSAREAGERRGRAKAKAPAHHDDAHAHDDDSSDEHDDDPYWWAPHAVMSALVLVGVLGFFGMFNKVLAGIAAKPAGATPAATATAAAATVAAKPGSAPTPAPKPAGEQAAKEMFGAKHLLVMYKGGRRAPGTIERTKEEAKTRAEEAAVKAKDKSKFDDLVKEYSDEPGAGSRGGDLGTFPKGSMVPEFQDALEKLKVGDVSGIVESPFGYHVILRTK